MRFEDPPIGRGVELTPFNEIWSEGTLFHLTKRWPRHGEAGQADRVASILEHGLVAPGYDPQKTIVSDVNITVEGSEIPYDSVVYLHKFDPKCSFLYLPCNADDVCFFIDSNISLREPWDMGYAWPILCQDEVYVPGMIAKESLAGIAVSTFVLDEVRQEFGEVLATASLPLYAFDPHGNIYQIN